MSERRTFAIDCAILFALTAILIWPLFRIVYLDNWMSIEGSFIGDARYIAEHWRHPRWHSLWYCGNRFDYVYPPLTRYGAALIARWFDVEAARGYHIYTGLMYCLGVSGAYALAHVTMRSRRAAWTVGAAHALVSPSLWFLAAVRDDSVRWMPERLNVLVKWGEGPHVSSFALVLWALALGWVGLRGSRWALAGAAIASALAVSNNFYGAVSLAVMLTLAAFAIWKETGDRWVGARFAGLAALSYGLCAWWLTPSYIELTARNLMLVALPGLAWSKWTAVAVGIAFAVTARRNACVTFASGAALLFAMVVLGHAWFDFRITGDPKRFYPEFDFAMTFAAVELVRRRRRFAIAGIAAGAASAALYLSNPWSVFVEDRKPRERVEYKLAQWMNTNMPGARAYATGSVRLWYGTWLDLEQVGGGSDQGMENLTLSLAQWQINMGGDPRRDVDWLIALGADAVIAHEPESQEVYKNIQQPRKFMGLLPVLYDRDGDIIYKVNRPDWGRAHAVNETKMRALAAVPWINENGPALHSYVEAISNPKTKLIAEWQGVNAMRIRGAMVEGDSILVQETWDEGWEAVEGGRRLQIVKDSIGFMRILARAGEHDIQLRYRLPFESLAGRGISIASAGVSLWLLLWRQVRRIGQ